MVVVVPYRSLREEVRVVLGHEDDTVSCTLLPRLLANKGLFPSKAQGQWPYLTVRLVLCGLTLL